MEQERHNKLQKKQEKSGSNGKSMEETMPAVYKKLKKLKIRKTLEKHYKDMPRC